LRTLIILVALIALLLIIRFLYKQSSLDLNKVGRGLAIALAAGVFLLLLATGRLHWLFALVAAAIPIIGRMLPLLRYVPLVRNLYRRYQSGSANSAGVTGGQTSTVNSRFLRMTLNHDSGAIDGEILEGQFVGAMLQQLSLEQLIIFLNECQNDTESVSLLAAYLVRAHPDWRENSGVSGGASADTGDQPHNKGSSGMSSNMSVEEAHEILGLSNGASYDDIKKSHRTLMQKLHPDHGGSTYLAAKINLAKDVLLK
jgi:hypothetical protein